MSGGAATIRRVFPQPVPVMQSWWQFCSTTPTVSVVFVFWRTTYGSSAHEEAEGEPPQLAVDNRLVLPVGVPIRLQTTGADVIHSWTIPAFGVKQDAVPGRLAQLWFKAEKEGIYFGQCSELCGQAHAYMPITVKVVSEAEYAEWLEGAIEEYAGDPSTLPGAVRVAAAE